MPVYNAEAFLRHSIGCLLGQSLRELELICVDDGSTDSSPEILSDYAGRDSRVRVIRQENAGPGAARNRGIELARGDYLIFLDADDWFEQDMLESMLHTAEQERAEICLCRAERFDDQSGEPLPSAWMLKEEYLPSLSFAPEEIAGHLFQFTYGMVWDKLISRALIERIKLRFPPLRCAEDTAFAFIALLNASRIAVLPEVKLHYRVNRGSSVSNSFVRQPEAPYAAFELIEGHLRSSGRYELYEKSFLNWAMEYLVWNMSNMPDRDIRRGYYRLLRQKWFPQLGLDRHGLSYYENRGAYLRYLTARYLPFSLYSALLGLYKALR